MSSFPSRRIVVALGLAGIGVGLTGCSSVSKNQYDAAVSEAFELRQELDSTRGQLAEAEARYAASSSENDQLRQNLEFERNRASTIVQQPPQINYGFEGIEGVSTRVTSEGIVLTVEGDILFDSGKVDLRNAAKQSLDRIASSIQSRYPGSLVRIEGYTDSDPIKKSKWTSNEQLSGERALAVEKYLVSRGLKGDRVYFSGFGPAAPKATKKDSRRVEIVIAQ
ncbi:MAG: OmpA family protein [Phycisphaeraceae bacterium]|nr:OmpA family protein [Phycisphaerales bacterium]MCB9861601.1 OmpA family protein [Phycisphaeraceae bacterium]